MKNNSTISKLLQSTISNKIKKDTLKLQKCFVSHRRLKQGKTHLE